jgi:cytochrome b561/polyisoprenoid-binding protein YceI
LGVAVFFVALARIAWAIGQPKPAHLHPERKVETLAASTVHWLLYGSLLIVPLSGWVHHAATAGFAPIWWPFGQDLPLVPKSDALAGVTAGLHIVFERVLAASIFLHLAGALKHHFVDRDETLRRMLPGRVDAGMPGKSHGSAALPILAAFAVWGVALGIGSALGLYSKHDGSVQAAALEAVQSDWVVQDGTLEIGVTQLGSAVAGQFADWTAAIRFDESITDGVAGSVEVVVSIGSLTLGSVTSQAMEPDFFNAEAFPTAVYSAQIIAGPDGYRAEGDLTIKDTTLPFSFPFELEVTDGLARMQATSSLDRRTFNIGTGTQPDETNVGFQVTLSIALTAQDGGAQ